MPEQIGLAGAFDTKAFDAGIKKYMSSIDKAVDKTTKGGGGMAKAWGNLGSAVGGVVKTLGVAAVGAAAAAGAAIGAFAVQGISKAKDLQEQMSNIASVMNKTKAEVVPLKDLILQLGIDPKLKVNATEAATAIEMLARNGLSMAEIMDGAAYSTVLLANATGADFGTAANIATDAMAIFKIDAANMATAVNGISAVTTNSKFDINDYALALSQGAGVASAAGVSFDDFNTSVAAISPLFKSGSDAGTSFKTMIASLNPNSDEAARLMKQLGLEFYDAQGNMKSMADIATELNDAFFQEVKFSQEVGGATAEQNKQRKLLESTIQRTNTELYKYQVGINGVAQSEADKAVSIDRLNREHDAAIRAYEALGISMGTTVTTTRQLTEEEKNAALQTLFGADASRAAIALAESGNVVYTDLATAVKETGLSQETLNQYLEGGITQFELLQAQMSQTDAAEQAATRMDNLSGAMEILQGVIDTIQLQIGEKFLPILQRMAEGVGAFLSAHADQFVAFFDNVATGAEALIGAGQVFVQFLQTGEQVSAAEFGLNEQTAALADSWVNLAFKVGETIAAIGKAVQPILDLVAKFVNWKDVMIVLAAALATVVIPAIWGFIAAVAPVLLVLGGAILAVAAVRTAWETDFLGIQTTTLAVFAAIKAAIQPAIDAFKNFGQGALAEVWAFVNGNETQFTNLKAIWEGVKESASNLFDALNGYLESVVPGWSTITEALASVVSTYIEQIKLTFDTVVAVWTNAVALVTAAVNGDWAAAWEAAKALVSAALDFITGTIKNFVAIAVTLFGPLATAAWQWIVDATPRVLTAIGDMFVSLVGAVGEQLPGWIAALATWGAEAIQWISDAAGAGLTALSDYLGSLLTEAAAQLPNWIAGLGAWAVAAWKWIIDATGQLASKVATWFASLKAALDAKLPEWKTAFTNWITASAAWLTQAGPDLVTNVGKWYTSLTGALGSKQINFKTEMLKWATALVTWISDKAADALPALGTWLGKILAWIPLGIITLATGLVKMAAALIGWIASDPDSATSKTDPELAKFQQALSDGVAKIGAALVLAFQNMVTEWQSTMSEYVDWQALGATIMGKLKLGIISIREDIKTVIINLAQALYDIVYNTDWLGLGTDLLTRIKDGVANSASNLYNQMLKIATDAAKKFTDFNWGKLGKAVIDGILKGLKDNADQVIDWIKGLAGDLVKKVTDSLGISSPSKVFMEIGENIIEGWLIGMQQTAGRLYGGLDSILQNVYGRISRGSQSALDGLASASSDFLSVAQSFKDPTLAFNTSGNYSAFTKQTLDAYDQQEKVNEALQRQVDLVKLIQAAGGSVNQFLGQQQLGRNADPTYLLAATTRATAALNDQLEAQLRIAQKGYNVLVDQLAATREDVAAIEARNQHESVAGLEAYKNRVTKLDDQIAAAEVELLNTGSEAWADHLRTLTTQRNAATRELEAYIVKWQEFSGIYERASSLVASFGSDTPAAAKAAEYFANSIAPLMEMFENPALSAGDRNTLFYQLQTATARLGQYKNTVAATEAAQKSFDSLVANSTFGETIAANIQPAIDALYSMGLDAGQRAQILSTLNTYRNSITNVVSALDSIKGGGQFMGDLLETYVKPYAQQLMDINKSAYERAKLTQDYARALATAQSIDRRESAVADIQQRIDLMQKVVDLADQMGNKDYTRMILGGVDLRTSVTPEQIAGIMQRYSQYAVTAANQQLAALLDAGTLRDYSNELGRIVDRATAYDDLVKQFDPTPITPPEQAKQYLDYYDAQIARLRTLAAAGDQTSLSMAQNIMAQRDRVVQYLRTYMDSVYRADLKLATLQTSTNDRAQKMADDYKKQFIDPVVDSMSLLQTPSGQQSLLSTLGLRVDKVNAYIASVEQAAKLEKDITTARGLNPLVGLFAAQRIDPLLDRLYDINTTEAQRVQITQQLVAEQQKLVALQEKQQKLDFLQQQLDLFSQIQQLNDQFDDIIPMESILAGITFGLDASLDDMLTLTSRSIDAIIDTVKAQLGIHSPSKVFAEIGHNIMAGMGQGMQNAFSIPINALRQSMAIPYQLQSRSLAINMGGVNISNGMDEVMFEARIHQIVEGMF